MILERLDMTDITEEDIKWLTIGCMRCNWSKDLTVAKLVQKAIDDDVMIYRVHGKERGIVVLIVDRERDQLWIELLAGSGLMRGNFYEVLVMMTKDLGLKKLAGLVPNPALARWYDRHTGLRPVATLYVEEVV